MYAERVKRWGKETVIFHGPYLVKRLEINGRTSMHYHCAKTETIVVEKGELIIDFLHDSISLLPGGTLTIHESVPHRMSGIATYIECSTPQLMDAVRVASCPSCGSSDVYPHPTDEPTFTCRSCHNAFTDQ